MPLLLEEDRDVEIKERLREEAPGIFNWAIEGLQRFRQRGRFETIQENSSKSFQSQNTETSFEEFMSMCCELSNDSKVQALQLFSAYNNYLIDRGYAKVSTVIAARECKRLGFRRKRTRGHTFWIGIKLNQHVQFSLVETRVKNKEREKINS
jgi:putative DNA primase/helicase